MLDLLIHSTQANNIIYVDLTVVSGDGTSWELAFNDLQDALNAASTGDEIWVATGTYTPSVPPDSNPRGVTFQLVNGVALYGGFPIGGGDGSFSSRDPKQYPTILSGDLQGDDDGFNNNTVNLLATRASSVLAVWATTIIILFQALSLLVPCLVRTTAVGWTMITATRL